MPAHDSPPQAASTQPRPPCRGCTTDCKNYLVCEGTPWRIGRNGKVPHEAAATGRG